MFSLCGSDWDNSVKQHQIELKHYILNFVKQNVTDK